MERVECASSDLGTGPVYLTDRVIDRMVEKLVHVRSSTGVESLSGTESEVADDESEQTKNKNYWKQRLEDQQSMHEKIVTVLEEEKKTGKEDVQGASVYRRQEEDDDSKQAFDEVAKCYQSNPKQPLLCDKEVAEFITFVRTMKIKELDRPGEQDGSKDN